MWNEHFGIGVVEMMAAGLITIAHNSGGPKSDIITQGVDGYLAEGLDGYAEALKDVFESNEGKLREIREKARDKSMRFDDSEFSASFRNMFLVNLPSQLKIQQFD